MQVTKPLFHLDAGWLYVIAGLAICAAAILVPVQQDLRDLRGQLDRIRDKEHLVSLQLRHSSALLDELEAAEPALVRRLAASQLNLVPAGHTPLLRSVTPTQTVTEWVDAAIRYEDVERPPPRASVLDRLTAGRGRLWMFGIGGLLTFLGLLIDPALGAVSRLRALRMTRRQSGPAPMEAVALEMLHAAGPTARVLPGYPTGDPDDGTPPGDPGFEVMEEGWRAADAVEVADLEDLPDPDVAAPEAADEVETREARAAEGVAPPEPEDDMEPGPAGERSADENAIESAADIPPVEAIDNGVDVGDDRPVTGEPTPEAPVETAATEPGDDDDDADGAEDDEWEYVEVDEDSPLPAEDDEYEYEYVYVDEDDETAAADTAPTAANGDGGPRRRRTSRKAG